MDDKTLPDHAFVTFAARYGPKDGENLGEWAKRVDAHPADCVLAMFGSGPLVERFALEIAEVKGDS